MPRRTFVAALNCMDGRVQLPVINWMKRNCHVDYVDMITESGIDKIVARNAPHATINSIKKRVTISTEKHHSHSIAIVGHAECAGNPVTEKEHRAHIRSAMKKIHSWGYARRVVGLWVDEAWKVHEIIRD